MTEDLYELNNDIINHVYELDEVQQIIKEFAKLETFTENDEFHLREIGERHVKLMQKVKVLLEAYFSEEAKAGLPSYIAYHRLYKQLKKAL